MHGATFVADLAIVLGVAGVTSVLARLLRQPTILGYLFAGLIVGPYIPVPIFAHPGRVQSLAEFGVLLVMFAIGLEFRISKLLSVLPTSGLTGLIQVSFLLWCGFSLGQLLGWTTVQSVFLGASIAISSTMVVSKVFEQHPVAPNIRQYVLGVLVVQDVLAIILIAAMTGVAAGGGLEPSQLMTTLGGLAVVLFALLAGGLLVVPRLMRAVARFQSTEILGVVSIGLCFGIAELAASLGYSVALGAFVAGMLVAESGKGVAVEHLIRPLRDVFAAIFFVSIGMTVDPLHALDSLPVALLVFIVVVAGQFVSVSTVGLLSGNGLSRSVTAALSLGQIGEFGFIIAAIGISAGVVGPELQSIVVTVAVLTAFTTPLFLSAADRVVEAVDRRMPARAQHLLSLHEEWLERSRTSTSAARSGPVRRAVRALVFDAVALIVLTGLSVALQSEVSAWLEGRFDMSQAQARSLFGGGVLLIAVPLFAALLRNTTSIARLVSARIVPSDGGFTPSSRIAVNSFRVMVHLVVVLGVGLPAIAIIRPFTTGAYGAAVLALVVAVLGIHLWRSTRAVEDQFRSGAEQIADALRKRAGGETVTTLVDPTLIPGLDTVRGIVLPERGFAVDRTLADVNLRCQTGATVVAIHRGQSDVILPTGHEKLLAGDVLAVTGTQDALEKARQALVQGPGT
ncbi:MAG: cation:proton antiporter [Polyangiales bacterium]